MIKVLTRQHSKAVSIICDKLRRDGMEYDLLVTGSSASARKYLIDAVANDDVIMVGNVGDYSAIFADTFSLTMFYDSYAEKAVMEYCKLVKSPMPAQHVLDKICTIPETFIHYAPVHGYQCGCFGEYNKKQIYILPNDELECEALYNTYVSKNLLKDKAGKLMYVFKVFGYSSESVARMLNLLDKTVETSFQTENLDTRITMLFPPKTTKKAIKQVFDQFNHMFGPSVYTDCDKSLAETVVQLLSEVDYKISTAESITGGMIASAIVDVPGSSAVFYEGAVTYSSVAKSNRLSISPHFIDEYGAVSPQVAKAMAEGLLANGSNFAIATTGYAGPDPTGKTPVGLCYIAIGCCFGVTVHKAMFAGDRNTIRALATNEALFLLIKSMK